jgi:hypothetical protein
MMTKSVVQTTDTGTFFRRVGISRGDELRAFCDFFGPTGVTGQLQEVVDIVFSCAFEGVELREALQRHFGGNARQARAIIGPLVALRALQPLDVHDNYK